MNQEKVYDPRQLIIMGLLGALSLALPFLFHILPQGKSFLPLFLPISIAGFLLELKYSFCLCFLVPVLSFILNGMPPLLVPPIGIIMMLELAFLVFLNYTFYQRYQWNLYAAAIVSLSINRIFYIVMLFFIADILKIPKMTFALYSAIKPFPGLILLAIFIPSLVLSMQKIPFLKKASSITQE
ncbi:MAG: ECF transporter S component [Candidatus Brocadiae bacterium]|nr:ECF transporter S component [Candidatus Brocadiia bacterium]